MITLHYGGVFDGKKTLPKKTGRVFFPLRTAPILDDGKSKIFPIAKSFMWIGLHVPVLPNPTRKRRPA